MTNAQLQPQTDQSPHSELLAAPGAGDHGSIPHSALRTPHLEVLPKPAPAADLGSRIQNLASSNGHAAPEIHQSNNPSIQYPAKRLRNGKISRLPFLERDMVNRMLRDHIPYAKIVGALVEHDIRVTERNVSNWKTHGGYRAWSIAQDRALETRLLQDNLTEHLRKTDAGQLPEVGLQLAATHLSEYFLKPETRQQLTTDPAKCGQAIAHICRLSRQIQSVQKYRDDASKELGYKFNPERVRRHDEKRVEVIRNIYSTGKLGELTKTPDVAARNFIPKELSPQLPR